MFFFLHNIPEIKKKPPCGYIYDFSFEDKLNDERKAKKKKKIVRRRKLENIKIKKKNELFLDKHKNTDIKYEKKSQQQFFNFFFALAFTAVK